MTGPWAALILAGGTSRRWGGRDKTAVILAGRPVLRHVVDAVLPDAAAIVVVAPADHAARANVTQAVRGAGRELVWTREDPPGGGPAAGIAAGLPAVTTLGLVTVLVLAGDLPFARPACPRLLSALDQGGDVALGVDPHGRRQPLLAAYRTRALQARLADHPAANRPLRDLLEGLSVVQVLVTVDEALDLDTPADAERAEGVAARSRS